MDKSSASTPKSALRRKKFGLGGQNPEEPKKKPTFKLNLVDTLSYKPQQYGGSSEERNSSGKAFSGTLSGESQNVSK